MSEASLAGSIAQTSTGQQAKADEQWPVFMTAEWRNLVMLNFDVPPEVLRPLVPSGTELDFFHGRALVSVIGFQFLKTRVLGLPLPMHQNFPEVNLRFYVRRRVAGEERRGVAFIKEIVPRRAIAYVARVLYHENYVRLPMRERVEMVGDDPPRLRSAAYDWQQQDQWSTVAATTTNLAASPATGSEAQFISEHYWGYSAQPDGSCLEYRVTHPRWSIAAANECHFECDVAKLYGEPFVAPLAEPPTSALLLEGSAVTVSHGRRVTALAKR